MPVYNKLVRDRVPDIIAASGEKAIVRNLTEAERTRALQRKLEEEFREYMRAPENRAALEELADMLEVIRSLAHIHGADWAGLEDMREQKAGERGGFQDGIFLIEVVDE